LLIPSALLFIWNRAFRPSACKAHCKDELTGVKTMLESGDYDPQDVIYPLEDETLLGMAKKYKAA
ncbi:MAG: hypothetical protein JRI97_04245, partial [Deltaproteobacteria bacterium]|nr:hypothetical protein [Deltaproteobacteria bacterium]